MGNADFQSRIQLISPMHLASLCMCASLRQRGAGSHLNMNGLRQKRNDVESPSKLDDCKMFWYVYIMRTPLTGRHAMSSKSRDTRENQKKLYDQRIQERRADLEKKGITPKEINKDKVHEHLKAKRRAIMKAIAAIDDGNARNEHRKEAAAEQAAPAPAPPKRRSPRRRSRRRPRRLLPPRLAIRQLSRVVCPTRRYEIPVTPHRSQYEKLRQNVNCPLQGWCSPLILKLPRSPFLGNWTR
jgi:hypothetical protein